MLHELVAYADKHLADSEPGFKTREVRWSIELAADGRFLNILPLGDGKRGADLPRCPDMHGMNAGGKSHFLVESAQTVALLFKANEDDKNISGAKTRHRFYTQLLRDAAQTHLQLGMLAKLLENDNRCEEIRTALVTQKAKPTDWVTWRIAGDNPLTSEALQEWWRKWRRNDLDQHNRKSSDSPRKSTAKNSNFMRCYLTGELDMPLLRHSKIEGLPGAKGKVNSFGDPLVSFDKAAFCSFGLKESANAAIGEEAAQKYVDALNDLIRKHSRKLANTLVAHWYKHNLPPEDDPLAFLVDMEPNEQSEAAALIAARRLLDAIRAGARPELADNHYYALTLSGAAGRVMVRDWMEGPFEELVAHIESWFADMEIVAFDGKGNARDPRFFEICLALIRNDRRKSITENLKTLPAPTSTALWKAAVQGLPIPQPAFSMALAQFRSERFSPDERNREVFNHARMGLIKAYFIRRKPGGDTTMTTTYNPNHPAAAYHCGGLLALLANLQRAALGDVGAGVVQRFYAAASQTPGLVLGRLAANARNHLAKLEPGLAWWYEERIAEIMSGLGDAAPRILDLEGQGLFALGYYQKLAQLRAGNKSTTDNTSQQGV